MKPSGIKPDKITKHFQLIAVWFLALISIVGLIYLIIIEVKDLPFLQVILAVGALIFVYMFINRIYMLQTEHREKFLEDPYYYEHLKNQQEQFKNFKAEKIQSSPESIATVNEVDTSWGQRERKRIQIYEKNHGLFLVHVWIPSRMPGHVADVSISLLQHGDGPLTEGHVKSVEYHLGPKFSSNAITKTDPKDNFALNISAYGPMLCIARVNFNDGSSPLDLERYINF